MPLTIAYWLQYFSCVQIALLNESGANYKMIEKIFLIWGIKKKVLHLPRCLLLFRIHHTSRCLHCGGNNE